MQEVEMLRKLVGITKNYDKGHIGFYVQAYEELTNYILQADRVGWFLVSVASCRVLFL